MEPTMARIQLDIDAELKTRLRLIAVKQDQTMSEVVTAALLDYLKKKEPKA